MAQRLGPRTSAVEIYQQIAGIFNSLEQNGAAGDEYAINTAHEHLCELALEAGDIGITLTVPTPEELRERHKQSKLLEDDAYYEESYETSQVC
jgi:hypothetical protein